MTLYYHADYLAAAHAFATTRKPGWVHDDLRLHPLPGLAWAAPSPATIAQLVAAHDPAYVDAVRTGSPAKLASGCGFPWDPGLWTATTRSTGGVIAAALSAWRTRANAGSLSSGLHHARRENGAAFCTFNGLAVAALAVLAAGARRILILDLDAHGGGGTHRILGADPRIIHLDLCTCAYDRHPAAAPSAYHLITSADHYLPTLTDRLAAALSAGPFDLCLYNAGVDCHEADPGGGLPGINAELLLRREETVFAWGLAHAVPIAFVLAGGYPDENHPPSAVVALHRQTIETALRANASRAKPSSARPATARPKTAPRPPTPPAGAATASAQPSQPTKPASPAAAAARSFEACALTHRGKVRAKNEDAFVLGAFVQPAAAPAPVIHETTLDADGTLAAVIDGMGDHGDGDLAATWLARRWGGLRAASAAVLRKQLCADHLALLADARGSATPDRGAVAVGAVLRARSVDLFHVGDARAYLVGRERSTCLTRDDARPDGILTQAFGGCDAAITPHIAPLDWPADHVLLLASDGAWRYFTPTLLSTVFGARPRLRDFILTLAALALEETADDNLTLLALRPRPPS